METLLGRAKAIEYLQYVEIIKTYIGVNGGANGDGHIAPAGAGDALITADLTSLATKTKPNSTDKYGDNEHWMTAAEAQGRINTAQDLAVWYDVEKIIGKAFVAEFKLHIAEVKAKESVAAAKVYLDYVYKAFDIQNTTTYLEKLKEIRKRIMNLRFLTCIDLANAIAFNKLWIEMESLEGKKGDDTPDNIIILAVGATDTYIKDQLID